MDSVVYLAANYEASLLKIGFTTNPKQRLIALQNDCGSKMRFVAFLDGDKVLETFALTIWREYLVRGEWFRYNEKIIEWFILHERRVENYEAMQLTTNIKMPKTLHIERDTITQIEALAFKENRTFSAMADMLLLEGIEARSVQTPETTKAAG